MSLPTLVKSWQFGTANSMINQAIAASGTSLTTNRTLLLALKNSLISGQFTTPWQIRGSCDSSTATAVIASGAAGPATDRWTSTSSLVWNAEASAHSWIVLRQTGIGSTFEILISCANSSANGTTLYISGAAGGFTGGTTTARPTAISSDEVIILNVGNFGGVTTDAAIKLHVFMSSDGACTRIIFYTASLTSCLAIIDKPSNPVSGWTNPWVAGWSSTNAGSSTLAVYSAWGLAALAVGRGASNMTMAFTGENAGLAGNGPLSSAGVQAPNDLSGNYFLQQIGLYSATASNRGQHGYLFDMWWANTVLTEGSGFPGSGTLGQFRVCGDFAFPWAGGGATMAIV